MLDHTENGRRPSVFVGLIGLGTIAVLVGGVVYYSDGSIAKPQRDPSRIAYAPRKTSVDVSGFAEVTQRVQTWPVGASLEEIGRSWHRVGYRNAERIDQELAQLRVAGDRTIALLFEKAAFLNYEGDTARAGETLQQARSLVESQDALAAVWLYTIIYSQGLTALRRGETENCIECRGECSCILPIVPAAVHPKPAGSRLAIRYFTEYLRRFPDDLEVRWLLSLAHMTLGEQPHQVEPSFRVSLDRFLKSEFDLGPFRDAGARVGVNRFNNAGGAILDDFDNDGLLDLVVTTWDLTAHMAFYRNKGDGTFEDRSAAAGLTGQLGGTNCVQADYNNDGRPDVFVMRGGWLRHPIRPSLLRNNGDGTFADVTAEAGLLQPLNTMCSAWADYDNDGWLDLFVGCEAQPNRLFHNRGDGAFEEVAAKAGVAGNLTVCKGCNWIDHDNDGYPDLFLDNFGGTAELYRNNRDGTFTEVSLSLGVNGPRRGFSCWAWDYDNDGWLDLFATSYDRTVGDVVKGLLGQPHARHPNKLYRNRQGQGFEDVTKEAGLDMVFATMGSNFADFDNDGYLDIYLATGDPGLAMLVPNRMFKNVAGRRFAEVTAPTGTGHLQKGHGVACGDWDRDGDLDLFVETGGAIPGDRYHNVLFQNPGQGNHWLSVKLVGRKSNRSAIGARIKVVTAGPPPLTVHRHVTTGSSFGANPLEQMIGLAKADRVAVLEVHWPTSGTTQVFRDLAADQAIEVTEFAPDYRKLDWRPIALPK